MRVMGFSHLASRISHLASRISYLASRISQLVIHSSSPLLRGQQPEALEAQVQLAAGPGIRGSVGDLRRGKARRGPVRCAAAFGNPESQEHPREIAHAGLAEAAAARDDTQVE